MLKIDNGKLLVFLCSLSYCFYFVSNNFIFSLIPIFLCLREVKNGIHLLGVFFLISSFFLMIDFYNSKDILILGVSTILLAYRFRFVDPLHVLKYNSYAIFLMIIFFLFSTPKDATWLDVISFNNRLSFDLVTGKYINPNPLAFVCAVCSLGFIFNKKYLISLVPIFIMLFTQSRAAIVFFSLALIFYYVYDFKKILVFSFLGYAFYSVLKDTALGRRFLEGGDSGRSDYIDSYLVLFKDNYLTGYSIRKLDEIYFNTGMTIDNMYYSLFIRYGVIFGLFILFIYIYLFVKSIKIDDGYLRLRVSIFLSLIVYGLFEKSFLFFYMAWIPLSICFVNLKKANF